MSLRAFTILAISASPVIAMVAGCGSTLAQTVSDKELVRLLASANTREGTVTRIVAMGKAKVPVLLSWADRTPTELFEPESLAPILAHELNVGLADVFGRLRTAEAIPVLIKNIGIERLVPGDTWSRGPERIAADYPAAGALVRIGPEASKAVIHASEQPMPPMDRVVAVFVVSRIQGVPEAKQFLSRAEWEAATQLDYARDGLKLLGGGQ